ncbi:MAG: glycoside hydrolase family 3 N-terminal domain-containing protein [Bacteroidia bacterium]
MRNAVCLFLIISLLVISACQEKGTTTDTPSSTSVDRIERRVDSIMTKLDLVDKVGEMTQMAIDVLAVGKPYKVPMPLQLDPDSLRTFLLDYRVGSILNSPGNALTVSEWQKTIREIQRIAIEEKPSGIPVLYGIDAIHGANYTTGAVLFPQQIGLAATWNPAFAQTCGEVAAYEARASLHHWAFAPVCDIGRDPRWPRLWETFGEDVYLASKMTAAMTEGFQGEDIESPYRVAACMKHFLGYSTPWSGKDRTPAYIPERQLQEYFVPPFQAAVDAGMKTVMICSGEINGIPVHANSAILIDLLRTQMGFKGLAVSDWEDIKYLVTRHRVAKDHKEAIKLAINAGIDMSMVPHDARFPVLLRELVEEGEVPMSRIDEAVRRILRLKFELGLFDNPNSDGADYSKFGGEEHQLKALAAASESLVLLKNENNTLPLGKNAKIFVTGPTANDLRCLNGGWTGTWQGSNADYYTKSAQNVLEALKEDFKVSYEPGCSFDKAINIKKATRVARRADAIVLCLGELSYTESPGSINDLNLPEAQYELARAMYATGKPVILLLLEGRPRIIRQIVDGADAILLAPLPGDFGGEIIAATLDGRFNPSGKLPYTYPQFVNSLVPYDHKGTDMVLGGYFNPQFEFGHGLGYSPFEYSRLTLSDTLLTPGDSIAVSVTVRNAGEKYGGKEVVQLYVTDLVASITPSVKRLRGFVKTRSMKPGESKTITFKLSADDLAFVNKDMKWVTEEGKFIVSVDNLSQTFSYRKQ